MNVPICAVDGIFKKIRIEVDILGVDILRVDILGVDILGVDILRLTHLYTIVDSELFKYGTFSKLPHSTPLYGR